MDVAVRALARRQFWVVARRQLLGVGLGVDAIDHRLVSGRLHRLHRGVYAYGRADVSARGRWLAGVLACGEGALLSHQSAGALYGIVAAGRPVHVLSVHHASRADRLIAHHRTRAVDPHDRARRDGIPVTSVARTLVDLATVLDPMALRRCFEEADRVGIVALAEVAAACTRTRGRRGTGVLRALVAEAAAPSHTRSRLEAAFLGLCREHGLPPPEVNTSVAGLEVDMLWRQRSLVAELDGWEYHRARGAFESDRRRDARLAVAGYRVYRLTWRRLEREPEVVVTELRALLTAVA
ncbi:MAG: DUF559 domain-containing protein [bacterium]